MSHHTTRRVAGVCTGTLLLCLSGVGTALAATTPADGALDPVTTTVTTTTTTLTDTATSLLSPSPTPTVTPLPSSTDLSPVTDTVGQVEQQVGLTATTPQPSPTGGGSGGTLTNGGSGGSSGSGSGGSGGSATGGSGSGTGATFAARLPGAALQALGLPATGPMAANGLSVPAGKIPAVAPQTAQLMASGHAPALAPTPTMHLPRPDDGRAPRGLFIALATMVIGALAAGHVKVVQSRLAQMGVAAG